MAAGTDARLAGKGQQPLEAAGLADDASEASLQLSAVDEATEVALDEPRVAKAVISPSSGLGEHRLEVLMHDAMQQRFVRCSRPIGRRQHPRSGAGVLLEAAALLPVHAVGKDTARASGRGLLLLQALE